MLTILKLFSRSPFAPLQSHMEKVAKSVHLLPPLFKALLENDVQLYEIAKTIEGNKQQADITKNDIRNHLPKSLFLAVDRTSLLEILSIQNKIANKTDTLSMLATIKPLSLPENSKKYFEEFLSHTVITFDGAENIIKELHELLESSFGGIEAEKVRSMVENVAFKNHEAGKIYRGLLKSFFANEESFSFGTFILWQRIFESVGSVAYFSEKLANRIRMTLELK